MREVLLDEFKKVYGDNDGVRTYFAPGRVNMIGEHTDYNGGHVFPCALTIGTYAAVRKNKDKLLRFYSMNFESLGIINVSLGNLKYDEKDEWTNYPKGVIWALEEKGYKVEEGVDILYFGNIPNGSGLSSSASIEVLTGYIINDLFDFGIDLVSIALLSQKAENDFVGVNSGIMDQFAIAMGKKDHAIFLDTSDLSYEYAPLKLKDAKIVIAASNKKRRLADSKYNERRSECETALRDLKEVVDIKSLGDLTIEEFEEYKHHIKDDIHRQRAKHAVYENQRTIKAVRELKNNNISEFGKLMNESHVSLRDDYEVTGIELDTLVEAAWKQEGVIGSRMTGAGFGGCTVSIVKEDKIDAFIEKVGQEYKDKIGYAADFYVVDIGDGPKEI
ncbi:MAG: galactokinase [Clostridiales bacterium]|nr:galactokinase [Clostridiales bacterium]